jgi:transcriptional regulator with XRE-family HTH domain
MKPQDLLDSELGRRLRLRREAFGMSLARLGAEVGVSGHQIHKYEMAVNRVSFSTLVRICRALDLPLVDLVREIDQAAGEGPPAEPRPFIPGGANAMRTSNATEPTGRT